MVFAGGFLVVIGFGMGALGAMEGRIGDLDKAPTVDHEVIRQKSKARYETPRPVYLAEEEGCYYTLLLVRSEAAVLDGELLCHRSAMT